MYVLYIIVGLADQWGGIVIEVCLGMRMFMVLGLFILLCINPLNAELNTICHLLTLLGAHPILHISRIRVNDMSDAQPGMKAMLLA
jgi:hypothetical protein